MTPLPTGTVTFLFTDIEGSTRLFQQDPETMKDALARHHALLQGAIDAHGGRVFHVLGDGFCSAFEDAGEALRAALEAQRALHSEDWGALGAVRVRMGLHTGSAEAHNGDYVASLTLARTQRVVAAGHGTVPPEFFRRFQAAFARLGKCLFLTHADIKQRFPNLELHDATIGNWLNAIESEYELVIYLADEKPTDWTRKAIRQADQLVLLADGAAPPLRSRLCFGGGPRDC